MEQDSAFTKIIKQVGKHEIRYRGSRSINLARYPGTNAPIQ